MFAAPFEFCRCPPELCERIFALACLDDGTTGRSLSLVSKYISDISKSFKLQSLVVRNLYQAEGLVSTLKKLSYTEKRVVHLFVVCDYPQIYTDLVVNGGLDNAGQDQSAWDRVRSRLTLDSVRRPYPVYPMIEELYTLAVIRILTLVSPTLRSLSISVSTCGLWIGLHGVPELPLLEELTLAYKTEHRRKLSTQLLDSFWRLPALRYLDLSRYDSGSGPHRLVPQIERVAPSLTTLRIPYVLNYSPTSYNRHEQPRVQMGWNGWLKMGKNKDTNLDENLGEGNSEARKRKARLPATVQKIVVVLPDEYEDRNELIVEDYRNLARKDWRIVCMTPEPVLSNLVGDRLEREWLERINDNDQYWRNDSDIKRSQPPYVTRPSSAAVPAPTRVAFPPELVDTIIDQIHLDLVYVDTDQYQAAKRSRKRSLDACSLVSKSWLPRSRYHLFESITLSRGSVTKSLALVALIHAPLSTIAPYVRELHLDEAWGRYKTEVRWLNAALPRLSVLSAIESLFVDAARFEVLETEDTSNFFGSFQMLRKLDLSDCKFATSEQLIGVLGAIPSLEDLCLDRVIIRPKWDPSINDLFDTARLEAGRYPREAFDPSIYSSATSRLHTFVFSDAFSIREILQWLVKDVPVPPIRTLRLRVNQIEDLPLVAEFLQALGPSVTNLTVSDSSFSYASCCAYYFSSSAYYLFSLLIV
jgi:hypothetical protein